MFHPSQKWNHLPMISIALRKVFGFWQPRPHFQLSSVQLSSAQLRSAQESSAQLSSAQSSSAQLSSAQLSSAQLSSARLSSAKLNLARFFRFCTAHKMRPFINDFNCAQTGFWFLAATTPFWDFLRAQLRSTCRDRKATLPRDQPEFLHTSIRESLRS